MDVAQGTDADLTAILNWLEREYQENGEGFWSERCKIRRSFHNGELWVIREDGEAVAFQVGNYAAHIICVRKDRQRQGYGRALFKSWHARAIKNNMNVLVGECSPRTSLPFWQKMGFERYGNTDPLAPIWVRLVLHREHQIPVDVPRIDVTVSFYPEEALYSQSEQPLKVYELTGSLLEDEAIRLPCRVVGLADDPESGKPLSDLVVKIVVGGDERCFCKAKCDEAIAAGVRCDSAGNTFYIDAVQPVDD